jgi:hypothetical protein
MKPSVLGLLIAAGAFGASTIYLAMQLEEERTRADQVVAQSRALQTRIAELEQLRAMFAMPPAHGGPPDRDGPDMPPVSSTAPRMASDVETDSGSSTRARAMPFPRPEQSQAFLKMMRGQLRAQNRQIYADLGADLGLTPEEAGKLIDLLTDQQVDLTRVHQRNPDSVPRNAADLHQKQLNEVAALIGYDKIEQFKSYQETLPARQEVATIARQLEGADLKLDDSQRKGLVAALSEERKRIPAPEYVQGTSTEDHVRAMTAWQDDYQQRTESRVRSILNAEQLATYDDYQNWAREMRAQFEAHRINRGKDVSEGAVMIAEPVAVAVPGPAP